MTIQTQNNDIDDLSEELASLRAEVAALVEAMKNNTASSNTASDEPVSDETGSNHWSDLKDKIEEARNQSEVINQEIRGEVRKHPLASIAIAFGVGYLASKIIK